MKFLLFISFFSCLSFLLPAQNDTIINDGIIENHLYFANNGEGKGYYEGHRLISKDDFLNKLATVPAALEQYNNAQTGKIGGAVAAGTGVLILTISMGQAIDTSINSILPSNTEPEKQGEGGIAAGLGLSMVGLVVIAISSKKQKDAINSYNNLISENPNLGLTKNGIGLIIQF